MDVTYLAVVVVKLLHVLGDGGTSDGAGHYAACGLRCRFSGGKVALRDVGRRLLRRQPHEPVSPDPVAALAKLAPVVGYPVEAVVAEARCGGEGRISVGSSHHSNRQPLKLTCDESSVPGLIEGLISDLLAGARVVAASAGINDLIAGVLVVLVPATDDDRVGPLGLGAADSTHHRPVHPGLRRLLSRRPRCADGDSWKFAEEPISHRNPHLVSRKALTGELIKFVDGVYVHVFHGLASEVEVNQPTLAAGVRSSSGIQFVDLLVPNPVVIHMIPSPRWLPSDPGSPGAWVRNPSS